MACSRMNFTFTFTFTFTSTYHPHSLYLHFDVRNFHVFCKYTELAIEQRHISYHCEEGLLAFSCRSNKLNSVALVRERTILTERPPPVGEVSANFLRIEGCHVVSVTVPQGRLISVFQTGAATFYSSSSSIDLTRLSGPRSRPTTTQKIW